MGSPGIRPEDDEGQVAPVGETSWSRFLPVGETSWSQCKTRIQHGEGQALALRAHRELRPEHGEGQALALRAHRELRPEHGEGQALALRAHRNLDRSMARDRPSPYAHMERFSDDTENTLAF